MAVVPRLQTINIYPAQCTRRKPKAAANTVGAMVDSHVSYRMQTLASQAEYILKSALPTRPEQLECLSAKKGSEATSDPLQPLDPGTISDAIPAFFVGRNRDGMWVARHSKGEIGGIFLFRNSATAFARRHSGFAGCAMIFPTGRFELDIANSGNPLAAPISYSIRIARRLWRWIAAPSGITERR